MRRATLSDIPLLIDLMTEFYLEGGYKLDVPGAGAAFSAVLVDERLGYVWIIEADGAAAGHVVVTVRFAMEFGGMMAYLDDLFVRAPWRNKGLSTAALTEVRSFCERSGIRAMTVEVGYSNGPAQTVYRRLGFQELPDRQLLGLPLAPPVHEIEPQNRL